MRVLELFCGIGGCAAALPASAHVALAVDVNPDALATYARTHGHPTSPRDLSTASDDWLAAAEADLWWMSPPCTPFTLRGRRRDLADPRAAAFQRVVAAIGAVRPRWLAMENVPGFVGSAAHDLLRQTLARCGYDVRERLLCPWQLGVPGERERFYLVAGRDLAPWPRVLHEPRPLRDHLVPDAPVDLDLDPETAARYAGALHVVDADDPGAVARCFTSAYGASAVRAGSWVRHQGRTRRFAPAEIAALLGHAPDFGDLPIRRQWALLGNSLSVDCVRVVLGAVPGLSS